MNSLLKKKLLVSLISIGIAGLGAHAWIKLRGQTSSVSQQSTLQDTFSAQELDQLTAPVALYPDALLSQILMASTWPAQVMQAVQWSHDNPGFAGDAALRKVTKQTWDTSVKSLVAFPDLLVSVGRNPGWMQNLGIAFLNQPDELLASVQRLRLMAQKEGVLKSTPQQKITFQSPSSFTSAGETPLVMIESADPHMVYLPKYDSQEIFTDWEADAYPPVSFITSPSSDYSSSDGDYDTDITIDNDNTYIIEDNNADDQGDDTGGHPHHRRRLILAFGVGVVTAYALYSYIDWPHHDHDHDRHNDDPDRKDHDFIRINTGKVNVINGKKAAAEDGNTVKWQHKSPAQPAGKVLLPALAAENKSIVREQNDVSRQSIGEKLQRSSEAGASGTTHLHQTLVQHLQQTHEHSGQSSPSDENELPQKSKLAKTAQQLADKRNKEDEPQPHPAKQTQAEQQQREVAVPALVEKKQQAEEVRQQAEHEQKEAAAQALAEKKQQAEEARQQAEQEQKEAAAQALAEKQRQEAEKQRAEAAAVAAQEKLRQ
jgi:hypothetical protein